MIHKLYSCEAHPTTPQTTTQNWTDMISLEKLVDQYCEGWSASSSDGRERLIRLALSEGATYCDPRTEQLSILQLLGHIAKIHQSRPGAKVLRTSNVDVHHGLGRFNWQVVLPDGTTLPKALILLN